MLDALFYDNNVHRLTSYKDIKTIVIKRNNKERKTHVSHMPLTVNSVHRLNIKYT